MVPQHSRVLVYQMGGIGDTVVTIPSLRAVRRHFGPDADICLLHEARPGVHVSPEDLLVNGAEVNRFLGYPVVRGVLNKAYFVTKLALLLIRQRFHAVVYLAPSERTDAQVRRDVFFFFLCGIPWRLGFTSIAPERLYAVEPDGHPAIVPHEALCRLERLQRDGIDVTAESDLSLPFLQIPLREVETATTWLKGRRFYQERKLVAICPGSKQPANFWPEERFVEVGRRLLQTGRYEIIVVGGPAENETANRMISAWGDGISAAGHLSILQSAALLGNCFFVIGLDTGTTHLAAAQGTPCLALYGERDNQGRFEPLGRGHVVLRHRVACAGCRKIETPCHIAGHPCMNGITVEAVWGAVEQIESLAAERVSTEGRGTLCA